MNKKYQHEKEQKLKDQIRDQNRESKEKEINLRTFTEILMIVILLKKGYDFVIRKPNKKSSTTKQYIPLIHGKVDGREIFTGDLKVLTKQTKQIISNSLYNELLQLNAELLDTDKIEIGFNTTKKVGKCSFPKIDYVIFHKSNKTITHRDFEIYCEPIHSIISELQEQGHSKIFLNFEILHQKIINLQNRELLEFWSNFI